MPITQPGTLPTVTASGSKQLTEPITHTNEDDSQASSRENSGVQVTGGQANSMISPDGSVDNALVEGSSAKEMRSAGE